MGKDSGGSSTPNPNTTQTQLTDPSKLPYKTKLWNELMLASDQNIVPTANPFSIGNMGAIGQSGPVFNWTDRTGKFAGVKDTGTIDWSKYFGTDVKNPYAPAYLSNNPKDKYQWQGQAGTTTANLPIAQNRNPTLGVAALDPNTATYQWQNLINLAKAYSGDKTVGSTTTTPGTVTTPIPGTPVTYDPTKNIDIHTQVTGTPSPAALQNVLNAYKAMGRNDVDVTDPNVINWALHNATNEDIWRSASNFVGDPQWNTVALKARDLLGMPKLETPAAITAASTAAAQERDPLNQQASEAAVAAATQPKTVQEKIQEMYLANPYALSQNSVNGQLALAPDALKYWDAQYASLGDTAAQKLFTDMVSNMQKAAPATAAVATPSAVTGELSGSGELGGSKEGGIIRLLKGGRVRHFEEGGTTADTLTGATGNDTASATNQITPQNYSDQTGTVINAYADMGRPGMSPTDSGVQYWENQGASPQDIWRTASVGFENDPTYGGVAANAKALLSGDPSKLAQNTANELSSYSGPSDVALTPDMGAYAQRAVTSVQDVLDAYKKMGRTDVDANDAGVQYWLKQGASPQEIWQSAVKVGTEQPDKYGTVGRNAQTLLEQAQSAPSQYQAQQVGPGAAAEYANTALNTREQVIEAYKKMGNNFPPDEAGIKYWLEHGLTPQQIWQSAIQVAKNNPQYADMAANAQRLIDQAKDTGKFTDPSNVESYMNPYQQKVTDINIREARRKADIQKNVADAQAQKAGAFGGYRQGLEAAEGERNEKQLEADIQAKGMNDAYSQALAAYNADQQRKLTGETANQQAGITVAGQKLQQQQSEQQLGIQTQLANIDKAYREAGVQLTGAQLNEQLAALQAQQKQAFEANLTQQRAQDLTAAQFATDTNLKIMSGLQQQYGAIQNWPMDQLVKALAAMSA